MSVIDGKVLKIIVFGESHGEAIGMVAYGLPAGERIDRDRLLEFMARRSAVGKDYATPRKEPDIPIFLSGLLEDRILNSPLCAVIENTSQHSGDYQNLRDIPRPGHADFAARMRYGENVDLRGGGHFSGRLTAPLCVAGAIAKQILERRNIFVNGTMFAVGCVEAAEQERDRATGIYTISSKQEEAMMEEIRRAQKEGDSAGGRIQCAVTGLKAGSCGGPMFDGLESRISQLVFGIPAVKGIEFGNGFECASLWGSENNDGFVIGEGGRIETKTNRHGGILGGIASGMPLVFQVAVKPTPSIFKEQDSVSMTDRENRKLQIKGRHDPCIVPRAVPCVEAAAALAVLDALLEAGNLDHAQNEQREKEEEGSEDISY